MKRVMLLAILCLPLLLASCNYHLGDFNVLSSRNVALGEEYVRVASNVVGEDSKPTIIIIPTGIPSIEVALEEAMRKHDGDLMTNVNIQYSMFYIPYIYGEDKYIITGDVWKKKDKADLSSQLKEDVMSAEAILALVQTADGSYAFSAVDAANQIVEEVR